MCWAGFVSSLARMDELIEAMRVKDVDAMLACMRPDVELRSPISRRVAFRGQAQVREVLGVVYATVGPMEVTAVVDEGRTRVLVGATSVGGHPLDETIVLELDDAGQVARMTLYVRAMPQLVTFAAILGPRLARRRGRARAFALTLLFAPLAALVRAGEPVGVALTGAGTPVDPAPPRPLPATAA